MEALTKFPKELEVQPLKGEENKYASDKAKEERFKAWVKNLRNDIYLDEAVNIMNDMVTQTLTVKK